MGHREFSQWWRSLLVVHAPHAPRLLFFVVQAGTTSEADTPSPSTHNVRRSFADLMPFETLWCPLMPFKALLLTVWTCWQRLTEALPMTSRALFAPFRFSCGGCYECLEGPSCLYNRLASELPQQGRDEGNKLSAPVIQQIQFHVLLVFSETSPHCVASCASCKVTLWYSWPIDHLQMMKRKLLKLFMIWILKNSTYSWWEVGKRWERSGEADFSKMQPSAIWNSELLDRE